MRTNGNYEIIASVAIGDREEVVIGFDEGNGRFVCWFHSEDSYFWGRYFTSFEAAWKCLEDRVFTHSGRYTNCGEI